MHSEWRRAVLVLVIGIAVVGCGGESESDRVADGVVPGPDGLEVTNPRAAALVELPDGGAAVVDGLFESPTGRTTRVWYPSGGGYTPTEPPTAQPLASIDAWWDGDEIVILGAQCPEWAIDKAAEGDDISIDDLCGVPENAAIAFDPVDQKWRVVAEHVDPARSVRSATNLSTDEALLVGGSGSLLNTDTGELTLLEGLPEDRQRQNLLCAADGAAFAVVVPLPGRDDDAFDTYVLNGQTWETAEVSGEVSTPTGPVGCVDDKIVLAGIGATGTAELVAIEPDALGGLTATPMPDPPVAGFDFTLDGGHSIMLRAAEGDGAVFAAGTWTPMPIPDSARDRGALVTPTGVLVIPDNGVAPTRTEYR